MKVVLVAVALLGLFFASGAEARPRDDVMSGAFRCAAAAQDRQWLECYYGAAQPLRDALHLPAATPAQLAAAQRVAAGPVSAAQARIRDDVMSATLRCIALADDRQWLDCYYAAAQPMRAALGLSPAPQSLPPQQAPPRPPAADFGLQPAPVVEQDVVISRIVSYQQNSAGGLTVTLENGQTWRQIDGDIAIAGLHGPATQYVATIRRGLFHSFNLTIKGAPGLFRVRRVR